MSFCLRPNVCKKCGKPLTLFEGWTCLECEKVEQEPSVNDVLEQIRDEIKAKIEEEEFARSVFRHEEKDTVKAEQCTGSIMAYNNVIKFIDKYKEQTE